MPDGKLEMKPGQILTPKRGEVVIVVDDPNDPMVEKFRRIVPKPPGDFCKIEIPISGNEVLKVFFDEFTNAVRRYLNTAADEAGECFDSTVAGRNNTFKLVAATMQAQGDK